MKPSLSVMMQSAAIAAVMAALPAVLATAPGGKVDFVREVQPITSVDGHDLPAAPGPITSRLAVAFTDLTKRDLDP